MSRLDTYDHVPSMADTAEYAAWSIESEIENFALRFSAFANVERDALIRAQNKLDKLIEGAVR